MLNTVIHTDVDFYPVIQPILGILDAILWPTLTLVVAIGMVYCAFLGVKISKAGEQNLGEKALKALIGAAIGSDSVIANAIIQRLVHHSKIIKITGRSYRIKGMIEEGDSVPPIRKAARTPRCFSLLLIPFHSRICISDRQTCDLSIYRSLFHRGNVLRRSSCLFYKA